MSGVPESLATPLPDSLYSTLVASTLLGFSGAIMLVRLFDLTSHRIERTRPPDAATSRPCCCSRSSQARSSPA